jgi:hypothetical protein
VNGLAWNWIAVMATVPLAVGFGAAFVCWHGGQMILGNLAGTAVIFGSAIALIMREHVHLDTLARRCIDQGFICLPEPAAFMRYAVYAFIGLIEVFLVFGISLKVEERRRRRHYAPEWR